jgi:antitoxin (DNA-binding transcriptional repressor) of toxin-antitoxin stability system
MANLAYLAHNRGMGDPVELSVSEARDRFSDAVNRATFGGEVTYITRGRNHTKTAAIVPAAWLDDYETLLDLRDGLVAQGRLDDVAADKVAAVPANEAYRQLGR